MYWILCNDHFDDGDDDYLFHHWYEGSVQNTSLSL